MSIQVFVLLSAIAVRTAIVFATLIAAIRLTGRRQFGEIDTKDIVVVLMVSNAVQNSMTLGVGRLSAALVSAATIIFLTKAFGLVVRLRPDWQRHAMGTPTVLVYKGRPIKKNMLR